jgi:hypothetical protein
MQTGIYTQKKTDTYKHYDYMIERLPFTPCSTTVILKIKRYKIFILVELEFSSTSCVRENGLNAEFDLLELLAPYSSRLTPTH